MNRNFSCVFVAPRCSTRVLIVLCDHCVDKRILRFCRNLNADFLWHLLTFSTCLTFRCTYPLPTSRKDSSICAQPFSSTGTCCMFTHGPWTLSTDKVQLEIWLCACSSCLVKTTAPPCPWVIFLNGSGRQVIADLCLASLLSASGTVSWNISLCRVDLFRAVTEGVTSTLTWVSRTCLDLKRTKSECACISPQPCLVFDTWYVVNKHKTDMG